MPTEFFKILGGTDPASQSLGWMTEGLGYPLRPVEPSISGGAVQVLNNTALYAASYVDQEPLGTDTPLQLTLGDAQSLTKFTLDAAGLVTCLADGQYQANFRLLFGRATQNNTVTIFGRMLVNGLQFADPVHTLVGTSNTEIPATFEGAVDLTAGDTIALQIYTDSAGVDDGGVYAAVAGLGGWGISPSVILLLTESVATTVI
jgi:hypothetical protein